MTIPPLPNPWMDLPTAVLFDLDGTLADTAGDLAKALNQLLEELGVPALSIDKLRPHASGGARGLIAAGLDIHPHQAEFEGLRQKFLANYERCLADSTCLFSGVEMLLSQLNARRIRWGVVTNKPHRFTLPVMQALGLIEDCGAIISGDSTAYSKPHPQPLLTACEQMGIDPTYTLYVGDDLRDIQAAVAANMPNAAAAWGYIGNTDIAQWNADVICHDPLSLLSLLTANATSYPAPT